MNVSGSSIAAYYAGNAALKLDNQAAQQQAKYQQQLQERHQRTLPNESVLEGELLNGQSRPRAQEAENEPQQQKASEQGYKEEQQRRHFVSREGGSYQQNALKLYQNNAQLDGFNSLDPLHQVDIYV